MVYDKPITSDILNNISMTKNRCPKCGKEENTGTILDYNRLDQYYGWCTYCIALENSNRYN